MKSIFQIIVLSFVLISCQEKSTESKENQKLLELEFDIYFKTPIEPLTTNNDCFEADCSSYTIYYLSNSQERSLLKVIEKDLEKKNGGQWRNMGDLYSIIDPIKISKNEFLSVEYSSFSNTLVIIKVGI